jgi:hypothetical protein
MTKEIKEEIEKFLESNENKNITYHKLWDTIKAMLMGKCKCLHLKKKDFLNKQTSNTP